MKFVVILIFCATSFSMKLTPKLPKNANVMEDFKISQACFYSMIPNMCSSRIAEKIADATLSTNTTNQPNMCRFSYELKMLGIKDYILIKKKPVELFNFYSFVEDFQKMFPNHNITMADCINSLEEKYRLPEKDCKHECEECFAMTDKDKNGVLDRQEIRYCQQISNLFAILDYVILTVFRESLLANGSFTKAQFLQKAKKYDVPEYEPYFLADDLFLKDDNGDQVLDEQEVDDLLRTIRGYIEGEE